jgi:hypothetical protein
MTVFSDYSICITKIHGLETMKDYRAFAEEAVSRFGYRLVRFGAWSVKELPFGLKETRQYSEAKSTYYDDLNLMDINGISFEATNVKGSHIANFFLGFKFRHKIGLAHAQLTLESDTERDDPQFAQTETFIEMLEGVSDIQFLQSDRMDSEKWVDSFASGHGHANRRNDFENKVAFSISDGRLRHHKPPFLFAYNLIKMDADILRPFPEHVSIKEEGGYVTLLFPRCIGKELWHYPQYPEWMSVYTTLKEHGILVVDEKLETMIEEAAHV